MKKPKDANQLTLWRFIAITMCLIWVVSFLLRVFVLGGFDREQSFISMPVYIGFCVFTVGMLIVLLIFPYQFYLYAAFCWIWGLARLADGGGLSALLVHLISYMFLYRQGFFNPRMRRWIGEDAEILRRILAGEKYEAIARDTGQSLSTLKKHVRGIFLKLEVNDRIVFISRYANHRITLEEGGLHTA
jgi:DNA-binding CsgD family transcriptional regulator